MTHHKAGQFADAERLYRSILQVQPRHPDANHHLGVLAMQGRQHEVGLHHLKAAPEADPKTAEHWLSYVNALIQVGKFEDAGQTLDQGRKRGLPNTAVDLLMRRLQDARQGRSASPGGARGPPAVMQRLVALYSQGLHDKAETAAKKLLRTFPDALVALNVLGASQAAQGKFEDAIESYGRALAAEPGYVEVHNNLGVALKSVGRLGEAAESYRRALSLEPNDPELHRNLGSVLQESGAFEEAVASFKQAVTIAPADPETHNRLGNTLRALGRLDEAVTSYRTALTHRSGHAEVHNNLGVALAALGRPDEAEASYRRALTIQPDYALAYSNLGAALSDQGRPDDAIASCRRAIELKHDHAEAFANLGNALQELGRTVQAVAAYRSALEMRPDDSLTLSRFAGALRSLRSPPPSFYEESFKNLLVRCFESPEVDGAAVGSIGQAIILRELTADGRTDLAAGLPGLDAATRRLLDALLAGSVLTYPGLETALTGVRADFLHRRERISGDDGDLLQALARQAFLNEFVWSVSEEEDQRVDCFQSAFVTALAGNETPDPNDLALLAAYRPLYSIEPVRKWVVSTGYDPDSATKRLLEQSLAEPLQEAAIAARMQQIVPIDDAVSVAVQAQYEENPYPRWTSVTASRPVDYVQWILKAIAPNRPALVPTSDSPAILIAGCGTGKQPILVAQSYRQADVLAVDLSRASLAYGQRMANRLGVTNVRFAQGDILNLGTLQDRFDVIGCSGVLHHMDDPEAGLRSLLGLLKPGGFINIGLYNETARQPIVRLRRLIEERAFQPTLDGIRAFRAFIRISDHDDAEPIQRSADFYATSTVRDLLFHVQEHRVTIPQLDALIEGNGLEFLGFDLANPGIRADYLRMFPDDRNCLDLENWARFESENPLAFAAMYQFWCRKIA